MANGIFKRHINRSIGGNILVFLFLLVFGIFFVFPIFYAVITAFKPLNEIFIFPPRLFVSRPTLDNFIDLDLMTASFWVPLSRYIFNSLFISVVGTAGSPASLQHGGLSSGQASLSRQRLDQAVDCNIPALYPGGDVSAAICGAGPAGT